MRLLFLFSLMIELTACGDPFSDQDQNPSDSIKKISISESQVYDLSGYAGGGGGNPFSLFDENAMVDPRYETPDNAFTPVTNCQPTIHPAIYFHGKEGNRIVIDLKNNYQLKEIYYYDRSQSADSCWIYTGTMRKWNVVSNFLTGSRSGSGAWKKITLDVESRFVMIRFSSYETAITEMVLYGVGEDKKNDSTRIPQKKGFTKTPLSQFLGVNYIMEKEPAYLKPFHYSRIYNFALDYDNDTSRDEKNIRFNMLHYGFYDKQKQKYVFDIDTIQRENQNEIWFSIRGVSRWMSDLGFTDKDRPLNRPLLNTEDPASYSRHAEMMWNMAAFFGYSVVDTHRLSLSNSPRISGRGSMHIYENGNEEDATWVGNKYCSPYEYYAQSTADWDGDEGRLGAESGIKNADSSARLMMSGLIGLDTNRVKVYRFLSENLRDDRVFIWKGGIQYHYYSTKNGHGISPEEDSMRQKLKRVADFSFRTAPGVKCFLGENGYDKSPVSWQRTPVIPGLSASQSQGIMLLRSINASFFSGFDAYILYWLRDGFPETDPRVYLTSGILRSMPDGSTKVYPGWYYISTLVNRLGNYLPDQVIRETGDVWIYKYRQALHPDSVAYFIYKPTVNGTHVDGFKLETGSVVDNQILKVEFIDATAQGNEEKLAVAGGSVMLRVGETPTLILLKEASYPK